MCVCVYVCVCVCVCVCLCACVIYKELYWNGSNTDMYQYLNMYLMCVLHNTCGHHSGIRYSLYYVIR